MLMNYKHTDVDLLTHLAGTRVAWCLSHDVWPSCLYSSDWAVNSARSFHVLASHTHTHTVICDGGICTACSHHTPSVGITNKL